MWAEQSTKVTDALRLLMRPQGATRKELAESLEVTGRTIYRLLDRIQDQHKLVLMGDRHEGEREKRWRVDKSSIVAKPASDLIVLGMSPQDVVALLTARLALGPLAGTKLEEGTLEAISRVSTNAPKALDLDAARCLFPVSSALAKSMRGKEEYLSTLVAAATLKRSCKSTYSSFAQSKVIDFEFGVISIFCRNNGLYAFVQSVAHDDVRVIALERIQTLELGSRTYAPPAHFNPEQALSSMFGVTLNDPITCRICFSSKQARYVLERDFPDASFESQPDGGVVLTITTSGKNELKRWVLSFGGEATVLEPPEFAEEVRQSLSAGLQNYATTCKTHK